MLNTAALMVKLFALTMLLGMGSVFASLPPLPGAPDRDQMPNYLSRQASMFLVEIQQETGKLLAEIQKETAELRPRAYTRRTFPSDPDDGEQRRRSFLDRAKDHISAVGERIAQLQDMRLFVLPWQQQAITELTSHAQRVAGSIQAAKVHFRENQNRLFVSDYRDHLTTIANHSGALKQIVDKFLDNEKIPKDVHRLESALEFAGD